jgi:outer membrane protein assembly factor BamB
VNRRAALALAGLAATGGCLRLTDGGDGPGGDGERTTATATAGGGGATTGTGTDGDGPTLTERWSADLNLDRAWARNQGFFVGGHERVASVFPSGVNWSREIPGEHGNDGAEAFALADSRAVFGISPDEGEREDPDAAAHFLAHNAASGERLWRHEMPTDGRHEYARGVALVDGVAALGSHLYGSGADLDPLVVGVDAATGERRWESHLAERGARYLSGVTGYGDAVCVGMAGRGVAMLDPATGAVERTVDATRTLTVGGTVRGSTFVGTRSGEVTAVALDDGTVRWSGEIDDRIYSRPAVDNTLVVVGTGAGTVYAFDRTSGAVRWERRVNGTVSATALTATHVWVADRNAGLTALDREDGTVRHRATREVDDLAARGDSLLVGDDETTLFTIE